MSEPNAGQKGFTMLKRLLAILALSILPTVAVHAADSPSEAQAGRDILAKNKDAIIFITAVAKMTYGGSSHDEPVECTGMVIDPSGLTICSLSAIDPASEMPEGKESNMKASISDVKLVRADNKEFTAKLVLKDPDLDLAFVLPEKQADQPTSFTAVQIGKTPPVKLLDTVITIDRLGKEYGREPLVFTTRISAIITKPRTFYLTSSQGTSISSPVFLVTGEFLGFNLAATIGAGEDADRVPAIIPAEDIRQSAQQVLKK